MNIKNDPFVEKLLEKLPESERDSFNDDQLASLKHVFGNMEWERHPVDLRWTLKGLRKSYYFVFIAGGNRRPISRSQQELERKAKLMLIMAFLTFSTLLGILVLYLLKSAAGINVFPNFSFGVWSWFEKNVF